MDVFYYEAFIKMGYKRENLAPLKESIYDFTNIVALVVGVITLKISIRSKKGQVGLTTQFIVVEFKFASMQYSSDCSSMTFKLYLPHTINV